MGVISERKKRPSLLAVTTTSSMGKSSVYNRLRLNATVFFRPIGYTEGWGHFHIADELFEDLREYLRLIGHAYTDQHTFGEGPNWRLRTIRVALGEIGISESVRAVIC
ncbi:MAG: Druantia anti-phage system protein DruA [Methylocella sp.]